MRIHGRIVALLTALLLVVGLTPVLAQVGAPDGPATHEIVITDEGSSRPAPA